ncbi:MAG: efflux RND transporter periplasmic adaptor subunit [Parachlamydiaceae bacterium]
MKKIILLILIALVLILLIFFAEKTTHEPDHFTLYGNVDVRQVDLGFRVSGRLDKLIFEEGDLVEPGTKVAVLDDQPYKDLFIDKKAALAAAKIHLDNAELLLARRADLVKDGSISQEDLENSQSTKDAFQAAYDQALAQLGVAETNLKDTACYAPTKGTILTRVREPGTVVREGDTVYTLSILSPVWIRTFIAEPYLGLIYPGMPAEIYTDTPDGIVYKGQIGFISPVAEFTPKTVETTELRTTLVYRLRVIVDNPDYSLKQGMPVTIKLIPGKEKP